MMKFRGCYPSLRRFHVGLALLCLFAPVWAQVVRPRTPSGPALRFTPQRIHLYAGSEGNTGRDYGDGGAALDALLRNPWGLATDGAGNVFIGDRVTGTVRRVDASTGIITTVAGVAQSFGGEAKRSTVGSRVVHGQAVSATSVSLGDPQSLAVDAAGNLYIAATGDQVVYRVDTAGSLVLYAGQLGNEGYAGDGAAAASALLNAPTGLSVDQAGDLYIADSSNHVVRRVDVVTGFIATVAGSQALGGNYDGDGAAATAAALNGPQATAVDGAGNLYISDTYNYVVRKVDAATGFISTFAGSHRSGYRGDGAAATAARLSQPLGLAANAAGEVWIADSNNTVVRKVDAAGVITTVAGTHVSLGFGQFTGDGGPATDAYFGRVAGVALDPSGNLFISASDEQIVLEVDATGGVLAFGDQVLHAIGTQTLTLSNPSAVTVHFSGYTITGDGFTADSSGAGSCNFAGDLVAGASCTLTVSFAPSNAGPSGGQITVADNAAGSPQIVDLTGNGILSPANVSLSIAPSSVSSGSPVTFTIGVTPGSGTTPVPTGAVVLVNGDTGESLTTLNLDSSGNAVYTTSALAAGTFNFYVDYQGDGVYAESYSGYAQLTVLPKTATITLQTSATVDNLGDSVTLTAMVASTDVITGSADFYSDSVKLGTAAINSSGVAVLVTTAIPAGTHRLQARYNNPAFTAAYSNVVGIVVHGGVLQFQPAAAYTVAGMPSDDNHGGFGGDGGAATAARLHTPSAVVVDGSGNFYIADEQNNVIRRVDSATGIITTYAGIPYAGSIYSTRFGGDGGVATSAYLDNPLGLALDASGNLFICDYSNNVVRRVDAVTHIITTVAGTNAETTGHNVDSGVATQVYLNHPSSVAFDKTGNMYIADAGNNLIRKVDVSGNLTTIAGLYGYFSSQGPLATQTVLNKPMGITINPMGEVVFSDTYNNVVRRIDGATQNLVTVAGGIYGYAPYGDGGAANAASLSFPEQLAYDPAGNLFIADNSHNIIRRVDTAGIITTVAGINGGNGSGYFYDPAGAPATYTPLVAPSGITIDYAGALYITDTFNQTIVKAGSNGTMLFGPQAVGSSSAAQMLTLNNAGDVPITFSATPYTVAGDYAASPGGTSPCNFGAGLAVGSSCTMMVRFTPTNTSYAGGTISFNSNAVNSPQLVNLVSRSTTQAATISHATNTNQATYGDQVLLYAQVSGTTLPPTGTVTFFVGSTNVGSADLAGGVAYVLTTALPAGNLTTTAVYSGDAIYSAGTSDPNLISVAQAATSTTLGVTSTAINGGQSVGLMASVSSPATVPITGTVSFLDGSSVLGASAVAADGTASLTTSSLLSGANAITARYNGTPNIAGSTSSPINVQVTGGGGGGLTPDYVISAGPLPVVIHRGDTATVSLTITPSGGYTGTVHLGCGTLPAYASCSFSTEDVVLTGAGPQTVTWTITTTALAAGAAVSRPQVVQNNGPQALPTVVFVAGR